MSNFLFKYQKENLINERLISKSQNTNKNRKINNNNKNYSLLKASQIDNKIPHKINYENTEIIYSSNDVHSKHKSSRLKIQTESNIHKLNKIQIESPSLNRLKNKKLKTNENFINKFRIFSANLSKSKKRISITNSENNNKKETQIYLNALVDKSIPDSNNQRIISSRGIIRKLEIETEKILKNKNKRKYTAYKNNHRSHVKNLDLFFHNNNYRYGYVSTEKNQNILKSDFYYDLLLKCKMLKNDIRQTNSKNKSEKENNLITTINNITRKVEFLNTKNGVLSNENAMNLLTKEEFFLYKKLNEYFKDSCSIKKFSKSIFNAKDGNKYLLPLFNDNINLYKSNKDQKNKNEINKMDYDFNEYREKINKQIDVNQQKIIELYLNNRLKKQKENNIINNIYLTPKIDKIKAQTPNQVIIKLNKSFDKRHSNFDKFYKIFDNNSKQIIVLKNQPKKSLNEKEDYEEFKIRMIKENENIINNYHQKEVYSSNVLFKRKPKLKNNSDNNFFNNIIPIKKKNYRKFEENKNIKEENVYEEHKEKNQKKENINKKIKIIIPENKKMLKNQKNKEDPNISKSNGKNKNINNNNKRINDINHKGKENIQENEIEKLNKVAHLSTKNYDEKEQKININRTTSNGDIKNLLTKGDNYFSDFSKLKNISSRNNINFLGSQSNNTDLNENVKIELKKIVNNPKAISQTKELKKNETNNNLNVDLKNNSFSNNLILKESLRNEENKLIIKIERKKNKTIKLLYSFLKGYLKDIIEKDKIKELLEKPEFKTNFDLLKSQMNQLNELKNISITDVRKKSKILTDEDVIDIICEEFNKQNYKKEEKPTPKSTYIPSLHLKNKKTNQKENKKEEKKEEPQTEVNQEKENEKLQLIANGINLTNELKYHIKETYNKEFRKRFQLILEKIESYQGLSTNEYVDTLKSNYILLKEEMNQVIRDKEREERINTFMSHLDSDRNIFEKKWNFCNDKIYVIDSKFQTTLGIYKNNKTKKK